MRTSFFAGTIEEGFLLGSRWMAALGALTSLSLAITACGGGEDKKGGAGGAGGGTV